MHDLCHNALAFVCFIQLLCTSPRLEHSIINDKKSFSVLISVTFYIFMYTNSKSVHASAIIDDTGLCSDLRNIGLNGR
jgi:hypothetical protein